MLDLFFYEQHLLGVVEQLLPLFGEDQTSRRAFKQAHLKRVFKVGDAG